MKERHWVVTLRAWVAGPYRFDRWVDARDFAREMRAAGQVARVTWAYGPVKEAA